MRILLFSLIQETWGIGAATFTSYLYQSLKKEGHDPMIFRVGAKRRKKITFAFGIPAMAISLQEAQALASTFPSLITYANVKVRGHETFSLMRGGVPLVFHDHNEATEDQLNAMRKYQRVVVIRKPMRTWLAERGVKATFIPHPYVPYSGDRTSDYLHVRARSIAFLNFRKHQEIIAQANVLVPDQPCIMHGKVNRMFIHYKLSKIEPSWEDHYQGAFADKPGESIRLFATCDFAVNLTKLKEDGDGTEYSMLEAWDAGVPLVVHRGWILTGEDEIRENQTALAIENAEELAALLRDGVSYGLRRRLVKNGKRQIKLHLPKTVVPQYLSALGI